MKDIGETGVIILVRIGPGIGNEDVFPGGGEEIIKEKTMEGPGGNEMVLRTCSDNTRENLDIGRFKIRTTTTKCQMERWWIG